MSISTVSLAQRNPARVKAPTRERIEAAIKRLGYVRNASASVLGSRKGATSVVARASSIAYVTGGIMQRTIQYGDPFRQRLLDECQRMGYGFQEVFLENVRSAVALRRMLQSRGCAGVVFGSVKQGRLVAEVDWSPFALVRCNNDTAHMDIQRVESDVFEGAWRVVDAVISRGYRKFGMSLFRHARGFDDDMRRLGALRAAVEELGGGRFDSVPVFMHADRWERARFIRWFEQAGLDALVAFNSVEYYWLLEAGVRIPEDVGIVVLTDAGENDNPVTGCRDDYDEIAINALHRCDQLIRRREFGYTDRPVYLNVPFLWHEGTTLPMAGRPAADRTNA